MSTTIFLKALKDAAQPLLSLENNELLVFSRAVPLDKFLKLFVKELPADLAHILLPELSAIFNPFDAAHLWLRW